ncbi:MAG: hypothetical protein IJD36_01085 [Clostridia bacterium]|nr:hypothetical protein [Clostridia bacterium]
MKSKKENEKRREIARAKLETLMNCENERVALSAAKEILSMEDEALEEVSSDISLEVTIKVIDGKC